ncbi:MAG: hypothetical protein CG440_511 [Methanosaeta sp. NSM2]|nr:hypothetical protein [Methanothrix sp.]OYV14550.1 MAG: hypothetical protein CG440_511 [Methanosaeta sp. NSM2]
MKKEIRSKYGISCLQNMRLALAIAPVLLFLCPLSGGVHVTGVILNASVDPGDSILHEITIKADESDPATDYRADVLGFGIRPDGANWEIDPDLDTSPYSAVPFLKVSPKNFSLQPEATQKLILEGEVPSDIKDGGRYALVNIRSMPSDGSKSRDIGVVMAFDIPILLTLTQGELIETGEITSVNLSQSDTSGQEILVMFNNTGNYHYKALAQATLRNEKKDMVFNASSPLSFSSIIPTYSWLFKFPLEEDLGQGRYTVDVRVARADGTILDSREESIEL